MSYEKMMKHQRTSIAKQKRKSYSMGIICSLPSDNEVYYPVLTRNQDDYDLSELTDEQKRTASVLMGMRFKGQPYHEPPGTLDRNLLAVSVEVDGVTVNVCQYKHGFSFSEPGK